MELYIEFWKRTLDFEGSANRTEYWVPTLANWVFISILQVFSFYNSQDMLLTVMILITSIAIWLPTFSVTIRRFHDTGKSGWYWLWGFLPIIGGLVVFIALIEE